MKYLIIAFLSASVANADQTIVVKDPPKKSNKVNLLAGVGPGKRFNVKTSNGTTEVKGHLGLVYGIQYERRVEQTPVFLGGQLQSNGTALLSVGSEF